MVPTEEAALRYLEESAIQNLRKEYLGLGYSVPSSRLLSQDVQPDLIFEKDGKKLLIEVVIRGAQEREQTDKILRIHRALKTLNNVEFKTVFVNPPKRTDVSIDGIEDILERELESGEYQIDIGNGVRVDEVNDVQVDDIAVTRSSIHVRGSFVVSVAIQYGPSRDVIEVEESFPGTFKAELDHDLNPKDIDIQLDTSSWNEEWWGE